MLMNIERSGEEQAYIYVAPSVSEPVKSRSLFCVNGQLIRALRWQWLMLADLPLSL